MDKMARFLTVTALIAMAAFTISAQNTSGVYSSNSGNGSTQVVTLTCSANQSSNSVSYKLCPNQTVKINTFPSASNMGAKISFPDGTSCSVPTTTTTYTQSFEFVGATNITLFNAYYSGSPTSDIITFTVYTPSTNAVSVTPVNSVVIPSDATGPVQIILESSSDLVNWTPALPGTYGSTYTNRFFRVRAVAQ